MTNQEIKELLQIFEESGVAEMEVAARRKSIAPAACPHRAGVASSRGRRSAANPGARSNTHCGSRENSACGRQPHSRQIAHRRNLLRCSLARRPPFVKIGDTVEPGQVLCIIESMKLMNEIEAEMAGTLVHKLVENGRPVEYGEALFAIRPR